MDIQAYQEQKQKWLDQQPKYRELCTTCVQPKFSCYCKHVQPFDSKIDFVILIHPIEVRRRIATGRMSHLCLKNSHFIMGQNYSDDEQVNAILKDETRHCVVLYPGRQSQNIGELTPEQKQSLCPKDKKLTVFVVDGTWATAIKTMRQSSNLSPLPRICFSPQKPSSFRVRKQPSAHCFSTIEAIHHTIELIGETQGFATSSREHDKLLYVFDKMVELQLEFIRISEGKPGALRYRRERRKTA